eukprot:m.346635 g.346635  ORF g.346635 m.346635 type:complete len:425 (-) comp29682_c0_seq1:119-1393(-)
MFPVTFLVFLSLYSCEIAEDCSLNGKCDTQSNTCECNPGWTGSDCGVLNAAKVKALEGDDHYLSGTIYPTFSNGELFGNSWGGNVILMNGVYQLLVSEMAYNCTLFDWQTNSLIRRATASNLTEQYVPYEVLLPPFAHNANPVLIPPGQKHAGAVAVFHVGDGTSGKPTTNCTQPRRESLYTPSPAQPQDSSTPVAIPYTVPQSNGTTVWKFENLTCVGEGMNRSISAECPHFSNAAPLLFGNGTTLIVHSGQPGNQAAGLNIAISHKGWYGPYEPVKGCSGDPCINNWYSPSITTVFNGSKGCTDPFIYMDYDGFYHCVFHCHWQKGGDQGGHAFSRDGYNWTTSSTRPFTGNIELDDGTMLSYTRQRPHLVLDGTSAMNISVNPVGVPIGLITGVKLDNISSGSVQLTKGRTTTHLQPIQTT